MECSDMKGISFEECMPIVKKRIASRMKWIWTEDIDAIYEAARSRMEKGKVC
jgi:salicylate hydroxylase